MAPIHADGQSVYTGCAYRAPRDKCNFHQETRIPSQVLRADPTFLALAERWAFTDSDGHTQVYAGTGSPKDKPGHTQTDRHTGVTRHKTRIRSAEKMKWTQVLQGRQTAPWTRSLGVGGAEREAGRGRNSQAAGHKAPSRILSPSAKLRSC